MILDEISLHNFGVYAGRQTISLSPPSPGRPVVLLGGLNGGGKTTLLDGLHLALYGKRARTSNRGGLSYPDYLRRCIHRGTRPEAGAAVELQFRHRIEGIEHCYRIHRSWIGLEAGVRERVEILKDGKLDPLMTDEWGEYVEEFLPLGLSRLFLFDGENIESLADIDHSAEVLSTAIKSLLGLEVVEQLGSDLLVLEQRKRLGLKSDFAQQEIEKLRSEVDSATARVTALVERRAAAQNEVDRREKVLKDVESKFRKEGGELFAQRERLEQARAGAVHALKSAEDALRELACGVLPFTLVPKLLANVATRDRKEEESVHAQELLGFLNQRDAAILNRIRSKGTAKPTVAILEGILRKDRQGRQSKRPVERILALGSEARGALDALLRSDLVLASEQLVALLKEADNRETTLVDLDRKLAGVPDGEQIVGVTASRADAQAQLAVAKGLLAALDEELQLANSGQAKRQARLAAAVGTTVEARFEREDAGRVIQHASRARATLARFADEVVGRHILRIQDLVLDSFQRLLRKTSLVSALRIEPSDFSVQLIGPDAQVLSPDRLSAGERQLFAISLLWGLARAAGRPIPAVIDTPLGRLDELHRTHLVERYFPFASHQVLLLSTDKEVDAGYFEKLRPWIGRSYRLDFDDAISATKVVPGYFWS